MNKHLTARVIDTLPLPERGNRIYFDDDLGGFGIRITSAGARAFVLCYRTEGRQRRLTIGKFPTWTATAARAEAGRILREVNAGNDPLTERERRKGAITVRKLVSEYIEKHAKPKKKTWKTDQRILNKEVVPAWGSRKAEDITGREIVTLLDRIIERDAPTMANRTLAVTRRMFNFAVERHILEHSPAAHVKAPAKEKTRDRVLSADEIKSLWHTLSEPQAGVTPAMLRALKLVLVTGQRSGEVLGMRRVEIEGIWWTIPGERVKNGLTHRVPLSPLALEIIGECEGDDYLFPSPRKDKGVEKPIDSNALAYAVRRMTFDIEHFTPHDLRRTMATSLGRLGFNRLIQDRILNHKDATMGAIYDRYSYDKEKRQAMDKWARELTRIIEGKGESSNVVELTEAAV